MKVITIKRTASLLVLIIGVALCLYIYADCSAAFAQNNAASMFFSDGYEGGTYLETEKEEIIYDHKTEEEQYVGISFPNYYNTSSQLTNSCANVAGANIIGYYDRNYENLIPSYTPGIDRGNSYSYYPMNVQLEKKQTLINELYTLMGTNTVEQGTSYNQYKFGFDAYVAAQGYTAVHHSVMSGSNINLEAMSESIAAGRPIVLFLSGYNFATLSEQSKKDMYIKMIYSGNHVVVAYGISTIRYYNDNDQLIATKTVLHVATGFNDTINCYVVNNNGLIVNAETVIIS